MADAQHHERAAVSGSDGSLAERQRSGTAVRWTLGLATAAMIVWLAVRYWDDLRRIDLQADAIGLVAAVIVSMTATWCLALGLAGAHRRPTARRWRKARRCASGCCPRQRATCRAGWCQWSPRAGLAAPLGVNRAAAGASVIVETAHAGWPGAAVFAALWAPADWLGTAGGWLARIVIGVGAAAGLVTLPWTLAGAGGWWRRIDGD